MEKDRDTTVGSHVRGSTCVEVPLGLLGRHQEHRIEFGGENLLIRVGLSNRWVEDGQGRPLSSPATEGLLRLKSLLLW
jgi:hypothetical protein